ncbi:MAG: chemotaxis protein CheW [Limisphaerales bacterium]
MLHLLFRLGKERYALPCRTVERIMPLVQLRSLPHAPAHVAGLLNYRGTIIPVIDLCTLTTGQPASFRLSSRIILAKYSSAGPASHLLGLLAEEVTETLPLTEADLSSSGLKVEDAPYLGKIATTEQGLVQNIEVEQVLPPSLRDSLFQFDAVTA